MPRIAFLLPNARELRTSVPLYDEVLTGTALMPPSLYLMERRALGEWREPEHYVQRLSSTFFFPPLAPEDFGCYYTYRLEDDPAEGPLYARFIQVDSLPPGSQQ